MGMEDIWSRVRISGTKIVKGGISGIITDLEDSGLNIKSIAGVAVNASLGFISGALTGLGATQLASMLDSINYQPALAYVPIQAESFVMRRQVDIGNTMLIAQTKQQKSYVTDNAAPRPRTWTIQGYITSLAPSSENTMLFKPTLQLQQSILNAAAESRQTVKLKADNGELTDVLIQDIQIGSTPKGSNVRTISVTVQEVKLLKNTDLNNMAAMDDATGASVYAKEVIRTGGGALVSSFAVPAGAALTGTIVSLINALNSDMARRNAEKEEKNKQASDKTTEEADGTASYR